MITRDNILLQGELVVAVDAVMQASRGEIKALRTALQAQLVPDEPADAGREVTIMGDKSIPFELLNRVMQTCTRAGYGSISLSVIQRSTS
jgi:biopolymer transport protein ExbD